MKNKQAMLILMTLNDCRLKHANTVSVKNPRVALS